MREIEVAHIPRGVLRGVAADSLAEEGQLETEAAAVGGLEIAGVIPPLGGEVGMIEIVVRKGVVVAGQSEAVGRLGDKERRQPRSAKR